MERVDVAITPLLTSAQRLALAAQVEREARQAEQMEMAREEEAQRAAAQRAHNEELDRERQRIREMDRERAVAQDMAERQEADKLRYMAAAAVAAAAERKIVEERARDGERQRARQVKELELARRAREDSERNQALRAEQQQEKPLSTSVRNCAVVVATDRRNVAALVLGVLVVVFWACLRGSAAVSSPHAAQHSNAHMDSSFDMTPVSSIDGNAANNSLRLPLGAAYPSTATVTSIVTVLLLLLLPPCSAAPPPMPSNIEPTTAPQEASPSGSLSAALASAKANDEAETTVACDAADGGADCGGRACPVQRGLVASLCAV